MIDERVLETSPRVLDRRTRERYFEDGFLTLPGYIGAAWLDRLRRVVAEKIEESRLLSTSDDQFDLAPDHSAEKPNIRRLRKAVDQHPELWAFVPHPHPRVGPPHPHRRVAARHPQPRVVGPLPGG